MKKICKLVLSFCLAFIAIVSAGSINASAISFKPAEAQSSLCVYVNGDFNTVTIKFHTDFSWAGYIDSDFVYKTGSFGGTAGDNVVTLYVKENTSGTSRNATVTIQNGCGPLKFTIIQGGKVNRECNYNMEKFTIYPDGRFTYEAISDCNVTFTLNNIALTSTGKNQAGFKDLKVSRVSISKSSDRYTISGRYGDAKESRTFFPILIKANVRVPSGYTLKTNGTTFQACVPNTAK